MKLTVDNFFRQIQDGIPSCKQGVAKQGISNPDRFCLDPSKHENIKHLFEKFLKQHSRFSDCSPSFRDLLAQYHSCNAKDGTGDYLFLRMDPSTFEMSFFNLGKTAKDANGTVKSWHGPALECYPPFESNTQSFRCTGILSGVSSREPAYYIRETIDGDCKEFYTPDPVDGEWVESNCKGTPLVDQFVKEAKFQEISPLSRAWSYTKMGAGIASTLYCGYKTLQEIQKVRNGSKLKSEAAVNQPASLKERAEQNQSAVEAAKKQAKIYGTATIASLIFTAIAYSTDFASVYETNRGNPVRFL